MNLEDLAKECKDQNWILIVPIPLEFPKVRIGIHTNITTPGVVSALLAHSAKISKEQEKSVQPEGVPVRSEPKPEDRQALLNEEANTPTGGETSIPPTVGA